MSDLLNGFNNGRDTTDGIGGQKPIDQIANGVDASDSGLHLQRVSGCNLRYHLLNFYNYFMHKYRKPGTFNKQQLVESYIQKEIKKENKNSKKCEQWYHRHLHMLCGDKYCRDCGKDLRRL